MALLRSPLRRFGGAVLLAGLLSTGLAGITHAQYTVCRSDPELTLSNGAQLTLYEDVSDTATDITSITYQVHVPVGVTVTSVQYSGAVPSSKQTITVTADENTGNYDAYTEVFTATSGISVTAYMSGTSASGTTSVSCHTSGHSAQLLHSHLHF